MKKEHVVTFLSSTDEIAWSIHSILLVPGRESVVIATDTAFLFMYSLSSHTMMFSRVLPADVLMMTSSFDGEIIATLLENQEIYLWSIEGTLLDHISLEKSDDIAFIPQTWWLSLLTSEGRLSVWDVLPAREIARRTGNSETNGEASEDDRVFFQAYSEDGSYIVIGVTDTNSRVTILEGIDVEIRQHQPFFHHSNVLLKQEGLLHALQFRPQHDEVFVLINKRIVGINIKSRHLVASIDTSPFYASHFCFSPDGSFLAIAGVDGNVTLWCMNKRKRVACFRTVGVDWEPSAPFTPISDIQWFDHEQALITAGWHRWQQNVSGQFTDNDPLYWSNLKKWRIG